MGARNEENKKPKTDKTMIKATATINGRSMVFPADNVAMAMATFLFQAEVLGVEIANVTFYKL